MTTPLIERAETLIPPQPIAYQPTSVTPTMIARIADWATANDTTFPTLVIRWADRGGIRALYRDVEWESAQTAIAPVERQTTRPD